MTGPALDPRSGGSELAATAVLLMLPRHANTPVAVLIDGPSVPSSVQLDVFDARERFVRLRKGEHVHGLTEPYRPVSRDEFPAESAAVEVVAFDRYAQCRFERSASIFGAVDAVVFVPRDGEGRSYERVRIPIPSLDRFSWHDFERTGESRTECRYRVAARGDTHSLGGSYAVSAL
ncbi:MAG TPA: hypothetical protein VIG28_08150 [Leifsonia sp.]